MPLRSLRGGLRAFSQNTFNQGSFGLLEVTVIVQPKEPDGRTFHAGEASGRRTKRKVLVDKFDRDEIIHRLVREDEEVIAIIIASTEVIHGYS